ncbi:MAG: T9SS type A sorting domain-containing protein [Agriterribacter sp.]
MKTKINTIFLLLTFFVPASIWAQCPGAFSVNVATTAASCPSNGSATITTSPAATASFTYTITAGPTGTLLNTAQSTNVFNALLAGNYTVEVSCGSVTTSAFFTIADNYTPITNVTGTVTGVCSTYGPGGTVTINASGGRAPLVYSIVQSNDPNYADDLSIYNSSPTKTVNSFGTYQIRVKDACNQFYTSTVQVTGSLRPVKVYLGPYDSASCNQTQYKFYYDVVDAVTWTAVDINPYNAAGGVKVNVYEKSSSQYAPTGPLLASFTANKMPAVLTLPAVSSMQYFLQIVTPCGDTTTNVEDESHSYDVDIKYKGFVNGCGTATDPFSEKISPYTYTPGIVYPLTVNLYLGTSASGTLVGTKTANNQVQVSWEAIDFYNLTPGTYYMSATDACGHVITQLIDDPTAAGTPHFEYAWSQLGCSFAGLNTQSGTTTAVFKLKGFLPNYSTATAVIISGPAGVGTSAVGTADAVGWINLLPGDYVARITTSCGSIDLPFSVPADPYNLLKQNITATAASTCGAGSGIITATTDYNGGLSPSFVLMNASTQTAIDSNTTGTFSGITQGEYYVKLKLTNNTGCVNPDYYINSNNVVIATSSSGPQITRKLGVVCEDGSGNPISTGTAYLSIAGGSPLLVEYKLPGSSTWITHSSNAPSEVEIDGLAAYQVYDIRITSCGITSATQVTIGRLAEIPTNFSSQPCSGSSYQLELPQLPGATYQWKNGAGNIVSTSYNFVIPTYSASYNGIYTATTFFGGCAKRTDTVTLNSAMCGSILLPAKFVSFTGSAQNCTAKLNWKISDSLSLSQVTLQRSFNGRDFTNIFNTGMSNEGSYIDENTVQGQVYYRLQMNNDDYSLSYSNPVTINTKCNTGNTQWILFPALLEANGTASIKLNTTNAGSTNLNIVVTSITGQRIRSYEVATHKGQNIYPLTNLKLVSGTYVLTIYDKNGVKIGEPQKLIYNR